MAQLVVNQDTDFRGDPAEANVDSLLFTNEGQAFAQFNAAQFGPGLISNSLAVTGSDGLNNVHVFTSNATPDFSAAGWTFTDWDGDTLSLFGSAANNKITGSAYRDHMSNGGGVDELRSGAGQDYFQVNATFGTGSIVDGGDDYDRMTIFKPGLSDLTGATISNVEILSFAFDAQQVKVRGTQVGPDNFKIVESELDIASELEVRGNVVDLSGTAFFAWGDGDAINIFGTSVNANTLTGSIKSDTITGTDSAKNTMHGGGSADTLIGGSNADLLDGGEYADTLAGGGGSDSYVVDAAGDKVVEASGQGTDIVYAKVSYALGAGQSVETLQLDASTGTKALNLSGNEIGNVLTGNAGANVLNGLGGADLMQGGSGHDSYVVDHAGDVVKENGGANGGTDTVVSSVSYALNAGQSVEVLQFASGVGAAALNLTGNELGNTIKGNDGANALQGLAGADNLLGGGGRDTLAPGSDAQVDTMHFNAIADSTGGNRDLVLGADFNNEDKLVFAVKNVAFAGTVSAGALNNGANFNIEIGNAVNGLLNAGGAIEAALFDPSSGGLNQAGHSYLVVDANNDGSYTAGADYLVELVNVTGTLDATDFI